VPEKDSENPELSRAADANTHSGMEIIKTSLATPETGDVDLLRQARSGDAEAFTVLYRQRADAIYRFALHMSGNQSVAEEVLQETFLALIRDSSGFDPNRGTLAAYVYGIARNRVRKHVAMGREFVEQDVDVAGVGDVLTDMTRRETVESVRQAVLALPGVYREAVVLCELQELSYEDAAEAIGCPVGTVRSRLHRGRGLLLIKLQAMKKSGVFK
jgi:RNA polymerase sigma-70 factor (ECF subfamily)